MPNPSYTKSVAMEIDYKSSELSNCTKSLESKMVQVIEAMAKFGCISVVILNFLKGDTTNKKQCWATGFLPRVSIIVRKWSRRNNHCRSTSLTSSLHYGVICSLHCCLLIRNGRVHALPILSPQGLSQYSSY